MESNQRCCITIRLVARAVLASSFPLAAIFTDIHTNFLATILIVVFTPRCAGLCTALYDLPSEFLCDVGSNAVCSPIAPDLCVPCVTVGRLWGSVTVDVAHRRRLAAWRFLRSRASVGSCNAYRFFNPEYKASAMWRRSVEYWAFKYKWRNCWGEHLSCFCWKVCYWYILRKFCFST